MLRPYRKLAKLSLKRARLSCISWKCIMFASRSAMASASSPKCGSKALSGKGASLLALAESRKEDRDEGRRGVVGRDALFRDVERFLSCDMVLWCGWCCRYVGLFGDALDDALWVRGKVSDVSYRILSIEYHVPLYVQVQYIARVTEQGPPRRPGRGLKWIQNQVGRSNQIDAQNKNHMRPVILSSGRGRPKIKHRAVGWTTKPLRVGGNAAARQAWEPMQSHSTSPAEPRQITAYCDSDGP